MALSDAEIAAIALAVYRRLAGGAVGIVAGPTSGDPLDVVHSADFDYTFDADVAADSVLVWTIRRDVADADPVVEIVDGALETINGETADYPIDGAAVRLDVTSCQVTIAARSLVELDPGRYVAEFREITAAGAVLDKVEVELNVRRSPSRRIA